MNGTICTLGSTVSALCLAATEVLMFSARLAAISVTVLLTACPPPATTEPTDDDITAWAGTDGWEVDDYASVQERRSWVRTCLAAVPSACHSMCDLRTVKPPGRPESIPARYAAQSHELIRHPDADQLAGTECTAYTPLWDSSWRGHWIGGIAPTWHVQTDAHTGVERLSEYGIPMRRRILEPPTVQ